MSSAGFSLGFLTIRQFRDTLIFKGGTCLKKCYFETYRFSEDLEFTLNDKTQLEQKFLVSTFKEISEWIYEYSGIQLPTDKIEFEIYQNTSGKTSCQGKLSHFGLIAPTSEERWPLIKLHLIAEEVLVDAPTIVSIYHPYSDLPENGFNMLAYSHDEVFAEKKRALAERTPPRDLYDVIDLLRQPSTTLNNS